MTQLDFSSSPANSVVISWIQLQLKLRTGFVVVFASCTNKLWVKNGSEAPIWFEAFTCPESTLRSATCVGLLAGFAT